MKTFIEITGQINGIFLLKSLIESNSIKTDKTLFGFRVYFNTVKDAKTAMRTAYNKIIAEKPEMKNHIGGVSIINNERLLYDSSSAVMYRMNKN